MVQMIELLASCPLERAWLLKQWLNIRGKEGYRQGQWCRAYKASWALVGPAILHSPSLPVPTLRPGDGKEGALYQ